MHAETAQAILINSVVTNVLHGGTFSIAGREVSAPTIDYGRRHLPLPHHTTVFASLSESERLDLSRIQSS